MEHQKKMLNKKRFRMIRVKKTQKK